MKFTQEVKDNWLVNVKSGNYLQGFGTLHNQEDNSFCCIGVLGDCTEGLTANTNKLNAENSPYLFLEKTIGMKLTSELYVTNDMGDRPKAPRDYSNVIHLIEALPVQE